MRTTRPALRRNVRRAREHCPLLPCPSRTKPNKNYCCCGGFCGGFFGGVLGGGWPKGGFSRGLAQPVPPWLSPLAAPPGSFGRCPNKTKKRGVFWFFLTTIEAVLFV